MTDRIPAWVMLDGMQNADERDRVAEGLRAAIRQYYRDNSDADEIDGRFWQALEALAEYQDADFEELVQEAQDGLTSETGRQFKAVLEA